MTKTILADQQERERIDALARVFMKADRVLSGDDINIEIDRSGSYHAPSWTDGKTIWFSRNMIGSITSVEDLIRITGLNYHELAHVLYTPRANTSIVIAVRAEGLHTAFNLLEDQRIETFLTSTYPSTIPYLVSTFMRFCIMDERAWDGNYVLAYGRRYLPMDVRAEFKRRFKRQDLIPQFEAIIDEYRKLVYPADYNRGLELIRAYNRLVLEMNAAVNDPHGHCAGRPDVDSGRPATAKEQREAKAASDDLDDEIKEEEEAERERREQEAASSDTDPKSDDEGDDEDGEGGASNATDKSDEDSDGTDGQGNADDDGDDSDEGNGNADGSGDSGDSDSGTDGESSSASDIPGTGTGRGDVDFPLGDTDSDIKRAFEDIVKSFEQSQEVKDDIASKQRAIVSGTGDIAVGIDKQRYRESYVREDDTATARRFAQVLTRLREDADPGWKRNTASGRLNVDSVMRGRDITEVWDRWQEGYADAADIECVINVDISSSMTYRIDAASRALWVIKRALETVDASVTVIAYASGSAKTQLVYDKGESANKTQYKSLRAQGNTEPYEAIAESVRVLEASRRANRIYINITDGAWGDDRPRGAMTPDQLIAALGSSGVTTALAYIGGYGKPYAHECHIAESVNDPMDLVDFAKRIVTTAMKNRRK